MRKKYVQVIFYFFVWSACSAQIESKRAVDLPQLLIKPTVSTIFEDAYKPAQTRTWTVFSDRQNNLAFTQPHGNLIKGSLQFMDDFYVIERKGDYLRIAKDNNISDAGVFSSEVEEYGWIHFDQLLLSEHCLVNDFKQPLKAILANLPIKSIYDDRFKQEVLLADSLMAYYDPALNFPTGKPLVSCEIHFVFKILHDAVLIGTSERLSSDDPVSTILGWVSKDHVLIWDNRIAIEPNCYPKSVGEREHYKKPAKVFYDPVSATIYGNGGEVNDEYVIWQDEYKYERLPGDIMRFPILSLNGNLLKVGIWGNISWVNGSGYQQIDIKSVKFNRSIEQFPYDFQSINEIGFKNHHLPFLDLKLNDYFYTEGFATYTNKALDYPMFSFVFLLSRSELGYLVNLIENLTTNPTRRHVQTQLLEFSLKTLQGNSPDQILEMTVDELLPLTFGIPINKNYFGNSKLRDLSKSWLVSDDDFNHFVAVLKEKHTSIKSIFNQNNYPYSFASNQQVYFWLDIELFP